jgi:hypothetical protein
MSKLKTTLRSLKWVGVGALVGMLVLGVAGRFVMMGLSAALGFPTNVSFTGMVLVTLLGGVLGAIGGILVRMLAMWGLERGRGILAAVMLFVISTMLLKPPDAPNQAADAEALVSVMWLIPKSSLEGELSSVRLLTTCLVAILFLIYGLLMDRFLRGPVVPAKSEVTE